MIVLLLYCCRNAFICQVTFRGLCHNHKTIHTDSIKYNSPGPEVKEKFLQLFSKGNFPDKAIKMYTEQLRDELKQDFRWQKSNRALLPSREWVYQYYIEYKRKYGFGQATKMLQDIEKRIAEYNSNADSPCLKFIKKGSDFAVVVVTDFMRRILRFIPQTAEMMFLDSCGSVKRFGTKVLLLMTNSCAGGLPIGVAVMSSETSEMLSAIFSSFKSLLDEDSFCGQGSPAVCITDDCSTERNSLRVNFPDTTLLLCVFRMLQACWKFLVSANSSIRKEDQYRCFIHVKNMMYSKNDNEYKEHFNLASQETYENFVSYVKKQDKRREEWVLLYRRSLPACGQNSNIISDAAFRILKEYILERLKATSPQQLLDFILTDVQNYYIDKVTNVANGKPAAYLTLPNESFEEMFSIEKCGDTDVYEVTNLKKNTVYTVHSNTGLCECPTGLNGRFCRHQYSVAKKYGSDFANTSPQNEEGNSLLHDITDGNHENIPNWFLGNILEVTLEEELLRDEDVLTTPITEPLLSDHQPGPTAMAENRTYTYDAVPIIEPIDDGILEVTLGEELQDDDNNVLTVTITDPLLSDQLSGHTAVAVNQTYTCDATPTDEPAVDALFVASLEKTFASMKEDGTCNVEIKRSIIQFCEKYNKLCTIKAKRTALETFGKYNSIVSSSNVAAVQKPVTEHGYSQQKSSLFSVPNH